MLKKLFKFNKILFAAPLMTLMFCFNAPKNDDEKMSSGLNRLMEEDPSFTWHRSLETSQTVLGVQGELHCATVIENRG